MHAIVHSIVEGAASATLLFSVISQSFLLMSDALSSSLTRHVMMASFVAAFASSIWALSERARANELRASARSDQIAARAAQFLRDGLLHHCGDAVKVWGPQAGEALGYRGAEALLEGCLAGPDGLAVSRAVSKLRESGIAFDLSARHKDGRAIALRGCAIGDHVALYLHAEQRTMSAEPDYRAALDVVPVPVWMRGRDLRLRWVNQGFLSASGAASLDTALKSDTAFDRSERELAASVRDSGKSVTATRYAVVNGARRALSFSSHPMPDGGVAGVASNIHLDDAEDASGQEFDIYVQALQQLKSAVAVFGADRRLSFHNKSYSDLWSLDQNWLNAHPTFGAILDRLRELRRLPEQHDFAAWKSERLALLEKGAQARKELWYLPDGTILQVVARPRPCGGVIIVLDDVSEPLRVESAYNALAKVQKAMLDTLEESLAVFGPDGRLRLHNAAFARQWRLRDDDLRHEPHLNRMAEACAQRFGRDNIWAALSLSITAETAQPHAEWCNLERADGVHVTLSVTRLPDGSTLAHFADVTDLTRLQAALHEAPSAVA